MAAHLDRVGHHAQREVRRHAAGELDRGEGRGRERERRQSERERDEETRVPYFLVICVMAPSLTCA